MGGVSNVSDGPCGVLGGRGGRSLTMSSIWSASMVSHSSSAEVITSTRARLSSRILRATPYCSSMMRRISLSTFCMVASETCVVLVTLRPRKTSPSFSAYTMGPSSSVMP
ncbi:Uncharacterised protein [Bordetella pertussis]|nr:Uncharacterised protein [Bordetella pertussis]CPM72649.1 Uncharacterised protein [Bordetella pertussis]